MDKRNILNLTIHFLHAKSDKWNNAHLLYIIIVYSYRLHVTLAKNWTKLEFPSCLGLVLMLLIVTYNSSVILIMLSYTSRDQLAAFMVFVENLIHISIKDFYSSIQAFVMMFIVTV